MKRFLILFFTVLISFINTNEIFKIHSHSGSWCDYETKLGKVNIQVIKADGNSENFSKFKMTLIDNDKNEYSAECEINQNNNYCLFTPPKYDTNLYYKENSLIVSEGSDKIKVENDFYIIAQKCQSSGNTDTNINTQDTQFVFKIHSHSGSWCDYETKLGKVNIQVIKADVNSEKFSKFKMTLIDNDKNEYSAECEINQNNNNYCLFTPPKYNTNLYYKDNSLVISEGADNIKVENDFYIIAQKCQSSENIDIK